MEALNQMFRSRGTTLETDATARLSQRPKFSDQSGATYEDFGSDFGSKASGSNAPSPSRKTSKSSRAGVKIHFSDSDSSPDELDCLSQTGSSRSGSPRKIKRIKKRATSVARSSPSPSHAVVVIDHHHANPGYKPIDLTKMKITKKKKTDKPSPTPSLESSQESHLKDAANIGSSSRLIPPLPRTNIRENLYTTTKKVQPLREPPPNQDRTRFTRGATPPREHRMGAKDKDVDLTPRPARILPRPVNKGNRNSIGKSQTFPDLGLDSQVRDSPLPRSQSTGAFARTDSLPHHVSDDSIGVFHLGRPRTVIGKGQDSSKGKSKRREDSSSKTERDINPFPLLSPLSSQRTLSERKGKEKSGHNPLDKLLNAPSFAARGNHTAEFPMLSPLSSPVSRCVSPVSSRAETNQPPGKGRNTGRALSSSEDERQLAPFPMATQVLESLRKASPVPTVKRTARKGEDSTLCRKKRRHDSKNLEVAWGSDEEMFFDPAVDPKTLCPWCDERLPRDPTPHLRALMADAKRASYPDDRITNPLGLRAPLAAFVGVCQRHRFERDWIPRARKQGWPTKINWNALSKRVSLLRAQLQAIVDDVDEEFAAESQHACEGSKRPRKDNNFWMEVVKNVRQQGSRQTAGVRGQFLHFNKTQPGYYGELGFVIIHQTLCEMFPPSDFHPDATLPLTPTDFISLVLVPEAAGRLIMEDLSLPRDQAIETLRESVEYGVAMFPIDDGEGDAGCSTKVGGQLAVGAGEQMLLERARARRKELEQEERMEAEEARREQAQQPKPRPRPRAKSKAPSETDADSAGLPSSPARGSKAKRKAPSRASSRARLTSTQSDRSSTGLSSDIGDSDTGVPSKRRKKAPSTSRRIVQLRSDDDLSETDEVEATPKPKSVVRPSPAPRSSSRRDMKGRALISSALASSPSHETTFVSLSRKGGPQIIKAGIEYTIETTPKAKPRNSDTLSAISLSGYSPEPTGAVGAPQSRCPLDVVKERRAREREGWR